MRIVGVDPGVTTGLCICTFKDGADGFTFNTTDFYEIELSYDFSDRVDMILAGVRPTLVVIESVVQSGHLSREKIQQIRAHDRTIVAAHKRGIKVVEVQPQATKLIRKVPDQVKGNHARDAYRVVMAYFAARK